MESSQTQVSPENTWIPQGIPTGVFVANNQTPVQNTQAVEIQTPVAQPSVAPAPVQQAPTWEGALDKIFTWIARFIAKISWQPDPITGAPNTSKTAVKTENIVGKVWNAANQAVEKATEVATKAADTVNQATDKIQQLVPPPTAAPAATPTVEQTPVAQPTSQTPVQ